MSLMGNGATTSHDESGGKEVDITRVVLVGAAAYYGLTKSVKSLVEKKLIIFYRETRAGANIRRKLYTKSYYYVGS